jgi:hypothetical protein
LFRRFPPPWTVDEQQACFVVRDHNGQQLPMSISRTSRGGDQRPSCSANLTSSEGDPPVLLAFFGFKKRVDVSRRRRA